MKQDQKTQVACADGQRTVNQLRAARITAGIQQVELAVMAGIQPGLLCRYERGVSPSQRNARRLAVALGKEARDLFPGYNHLRPY